MSQHNLSIVPKFLAFLLLWPLVLWSQSPKAVERLRADVYVLADDAMEGRKAAQEGRSPLMRTDPRWRR